MSVSAFRRTSFSNFTSAEMRLLIAFECVSSDSDWLVNESVKTGWKSRTETSFAEYKEWKLESWISEFCKLNGLADVCGSKRFFVVSWTVFVHLLSYFFPLLRNCVLYGLDNHKCSKLFEKMRWFQCVRHNFQKLLLFHHLMHFVWSYRYWNFCSCCI